MDNIREFIPTLITWLVFATVGVLFIFTEINQPVYSKLDTSTKVVSANYDHTADLTSIPGVQVIGMVPNALVGEFELTIDGITINSTTDISLIDLRGVKNHEYKITLHRLNGEITSISAIH